MSRSIEERLVDLETELAATKHELERQKAVTEIQNVMARYMLYHSAGRHKACLDLFAMRTPDVRVEVAMWGQYSGPAGVFKNYIDGIAENEGDRIGWFCEHPVSTPLIEVAGDGKTAKAIWSTHGPETAINPDTGKYDANWMYGKFAVEFIKENGHWKMWHFQVLPDIMYRQTVPYTEQEPHDDYPGPPNFPKADGPTTFCEEYDVKKARRFWPQPPAPYDTYANSRPVVGVPPADAELDFDRKQNECTLESYLAELEARDPMKR